jgi:hypothetical protein
MSFKQTQRFYQSSTQPSNANPGDEWLNITTNRNYQFMSLSGNAPTWVETAIAPTANVFNMQNLNIVGTSTFNGTTSAVAMTTPNIAENAALLTSPIIGYYRYNVTSQTIVYCTVAATSNFVVNITASDTTTLNSIMNIGQSISCVLMITNGSSAYYHSSLQVDGAVIAPKWQTGTAPTSGNTSAVDIYSYTIIKTANATFSAFASQTKFS